MRVTGLTIFIWTGFASTPRKIFTTLPRFTFSRRLQIKCAGPQAERSTIVVAENEPEEARLVRSVESGGYGIDGLWNDDFHHSAMVALTGHSEAYYSDYRGTPQEFISAAKRGFLYQGQYYSWQRQRRGSWTDG